jgi:hypothetical protein
MLKSDKDDFKMAKECSVRIPLHLTGGCDNIINTFSPSPFSKFYHTLYLKCE